MPWIWQQVLGPRLRWQAALCAIGLAWGVFNWGGHLKGNADAANVMREELAMGAWLRDNTPKDSKVAAFWHHYPKFIYGGESHNRFLAGMNTLFLLWGDPIAYRGFLHLFDGSLSDPEVLLAQLGFDYWLIDNTVNQRFQQTMQRARSRPGLAEVPLAQGLERFKLFRVLPPGTYPTAPPPQPAAAQGQEGQEAAAPQPAEAAPAAPPPEEAAPAGTGRGTAVNWPNGTLGQARDLGLTALRWTRETLVEMARFPDLLLNSAWAQWLWQRTDAILSLVEAWVAGRRWLLFVLFSLPALGALTYLGMELYNHDRLFNNDSYYHVGLAREYAKGWVDSYKWLPHTPLAQDPFPNLYLVMHLALAPVHWFVDDGIEALRLSRLLTTMLLAVSALAVQWLLRLPWGFLWAPMALASMPLVGQYLFTLKGGALFFPLFAWWCYALAAERHRLLFAVALVATLGYAGTWVLVPLSFIYVATESYASRRVRAQPFLVTALAVGLGVLVHPSFPLNIEHIARELSTPGVIRELSHELTVGFHIGIEWRTLKGREFGHFMGCLAMAVIFPTLAWRSSVDARAQGVLAMLLALSLGSVWVGAKMLILACVGALALAPWLWHRFIGEGARWQALLCIMVLGWAIYAVPRLAPSANVEDNRKSEQSALAMGAWLRDNTPKDTKVAAFWNHYPKFVYGGEGHNRFFGRHEHPVPVLAGQGGLQGAAAHVQRLAGKTPKCCWNCWTSSTCCWTTCRASPSSRLWSAPAAARPWKRSRCRRGWSSSSCSSPCPRSSGPRPRLRPKPPKPAPKPPPKPPPKPLRGPGLKPPPPTGPSRPSRPLRQDRRREGGQRAAALLPAGHRLCAGGAGSGGIRRVAGAGLLVRRVLVAGHGADAPRRGHVPHGPAGPAPAAVLPGAFGLGGGLRLRRAGGARPEPAVRCGGAGAAVVAGPPPAAAPRAGHGSHLDGHPLDAGVLRAGGAHVPHVHAGQHLGGAGLCAPVVRRGAAAGARRQCAAAGGRGGGGRTLPAGLSGAAVPVLPGRPGRQLRALLHPGHGRLCPAAAAVALPPRLPGRPGAGAHRHPAAGLVCGAQHVPRPPPGAPSGSPTRTSGSSWAPCWPRRPRSWRWCAIRPGPSPC